jgi:hypothetical protein
LFLEFLFSRPLSCDEKRFWRIHILNSVVVVVVGRGLLLPWRDFRLVVCCFCTMALFSDFAFLSLIR